MKIIFICGSLEPGRDGVGNYVWRLSSEFRLIGKARMGFNPGWTIMRHALGQLKPWEWHLIKHLATGKSPKLVDREFWKYSEGPLRPYSRHLILRKRPGLSFAAIVNRFYRK